jgi:hypothetical protein
MIELCRCKTARLEVHVSASIRDGGLLISGQDLGPDVEEFWGDSDYEYFYSLTLDDTRKLHDLLKTDSKQDIGLLELIKLYFSDLDGCDNFKKYCDQHDIQYSFFNYA